MHKPIFWQLLFGTLTWQRIATILVPGILASMVVWRYDDGDWITRLVLAVATVDIVSGGISNATQSTRARWQTQPRWQHWVFHWWARNHLPARNLATINQYGHCEWSGEPPYRQNAAVCLGHTQLTLMRHTHYQPTTRKSMMMPVVSVVIHSTTHNNCG